MDIPDLKEMIAQREEANEVVRSTKKLLKSLRRDFDRARDDAALTNIELAIDAASDKLQRATHKYEEIKEQLATRRAEDKAERLRLDRLPKPPKVRQPYPKGLVWFHDPTTLINTTCRVDDAPSHLVRGKAPGSTKTPSVATTFTDPTTLESTKVYLQDGEEPPPGYEQGTPNHFKSLALKAERKQLRREAGPTEAQLQRNDQLRQVLAGKRWWHHEVSGERRRFRDDETPPDGFVLGRLHYERGPDKKPRIRSERLGGYNISPEAKARRRAAFRLRREQETQAERDSRITKHREAQSGLVWWFNKATGETTRSREQLSGDWVRGQGKAHLPDPPPGPGTGMPGYRYFHDPTTGQTGKFLPGTEPDSFIPGSGPNKKWTKPSAPRSDEAKARQSEALKGRRWFHSPATNHQAQFHPGSEPDGYVRGKAPKN